MTDNQLQDWINSLLRQPASDFMPSLTEYRWTLRTLIENGVPVVHEFTLRRPRDGAIFAAVIEGNPYECLDDLPPAVVAVGEALALVRDAA